MTISATYPGALPRNTVRRGSFHFPLFVSAGFPIPRGTSVTLVGIRPRGSIFTGPCVVGAGEVHLPNQTMLQGQWVLYMVQEGDLSQVGTYTVQLGLVPDPKTQPPQATFQVVP